MGDNRSERWQDADMMQHRVSAKKTNKANDIALGVALFLVGNILVTCGLLVGLIALFEQMGLDSSTPPLIFSLIGGVVLLLNIGVLGYATFTRPYVAYGMLTSFAVLLVVVLCSAVFISQICFRSLN